MEFLTESVSQISTNPTLLIQLCLGVAVGLITVLVQRYFNYRPVAQPVKAEVTILADMDERTKTKLTELKSVKNYYDALQFYKTKVTRCFRVKQVNNALGLVDDAFVYFIDEKQISCACDISLLLTEVLVRDDVEQSDDIFSLVAKIASTLEALLSQEAEDQVKETLMTSRRKFVDSAVNWSKKASKTAGEKKFGAAGLHLKLAEDYLGRGLIGQARYHLLLADSPLKLSELLKASNNSNTSEQLLVAQTVLQLLSVDRFSAAQELFKHASAWASNNGKYPYDQSLLNLIHSVLQTILDDQKEQFVALLDMYKDDLAKEQGLSGYLQKVGKMYLQVTPDQKGSQGGFGALSGLFKGLLGGEEQPEVASSHLEARKSRPKFKLPASVAQANMAKVRAQAASFPTPSPNTVATGDDDLD